MIDDSLRVRLKREKLRRFYRLHPEAYARQVLKVEWTPQQVEIAQALVKHKRVFVKASHSVGKSYLAGGLVNWFFDCFRPSVCLTTAPNAQQVKDILWKEIRMQRPVQYRSVLQPKAPRMETTAEHFAMGLTARDDSGLQGRHSEAVLIVFDEGTGIASPFWDAAEGMMTTPDTCFWLVILNPTDTSSRAYLECQNTEKWHVIEISAMEHPNIAADLKGEAAPFPKAVRLRWILGRIKEWCTPVAAEDAKASDFEFPPKSGEWYRPGPLFESRVLGLWPTSGGTSVWTEAMWLRCLQPQIVDIHAPLKIGCDTARFGDDFSSFVVRRGNCVLWHETHNGWDNPQIGGRLKQLCQQFSREGENPKKVVCNVDNVSGGVIDLADGYLFVCINSANKALEEDNYPNVRSELWFASSERADEGRLDLSRLPKTSLDQLRGQAMAPVWKVDKAGRRVVEEKDETKKRIKRSPDDMDALNLAFYGGSDWQSAADTLEKVRTELEATGWQYGSEALSVQW